MKLLITILVAVIFPLAAKATDDRLPVRDNEEMIKLQTQDRDDVINDGLVWDQFMANGKQRRNQVTELVKQSQLRTAYDYWRAAMIFQHGESVEDYRLAHSFAAIANALQPDENIAWLLAASWDRMMNAMGRPQWYGTQYLPDKDGKKARLLDIEQSVPDEERERLIHARLAQLPLTISATRKPGQPDLPSGYFSKIYESK